MPTLTPVRVSFAGSLAPRCSGRSRFGNRPRDAEVGDEGGAVDGEEDVLRLDVAVNDALGVGILDGEGHLAGDANGLAHRELGFVLEAGAKGAAGT